MAWLTGWDNRLELTTDNARIDEILNDFPVLIILDSDAGRNNFNTSVIFDELTTSGVVFEDDFSSADGAGWETYDTNPADYSSGYMYFDGINHGERTINTYDYGDHYEVTYKCINRGRGSGDDQFYVYPIYSGNNYIRTYLRTYSAGDNYLRVQYVFDGGGPQTLHTGQKYSFWDAAVNNQATWVKIVREGNLLYFKYWREDSSEPNSWDYTGYFDPTFTSTSNKIYVDCVTDGAEGGARVDYVRIINFYNNKKSIAITDYTGTNQLTAEIERWNVTTGSANLWTKMPAVASGTDTKIYLYYDKDQPDNDVWVDETGTAVAANVWTNNYISVWHMNTDINTTIKDSAINYPATPTSMDVTNYIDTPTGPGLSFSSGDYLTPSVIDIINKDVTIEVLFKLQNFASTSQFIFTSQTDPPAPEDYTYQTSISTFVASNQKFYAGSPPVTASGTIAISTDIVDEGEWIHWVSTFPMGSYTKLYRDGYLDGTATSVNYHRNYAHNETYIGARLDAQGNDYLLSDIGILTLSSGIRSSAWVKASYFSVSDNLITYSQGVKPNYYYHGYVKEKSIPVARTVRLYNRELGTLMDETTSSGNDGYYYLTTAVSGEHFVVAFDDDAGQSYNAVISDKLQPLGIE